MSQSPSDLSENRNDFIQFVWLNRKFIIGFTTIATIIAAVVSFLLTPLYLSTAIVFPAASSTVSFSEQRNAKSASMDFGEEEQAEQLVQILQSSKIRGYQVTVPDALLRATVHLRCTHSYRYQDVHESSGTGILAVEPVRCT